MAFRKEDYWIRPRKQLLEYQIAFFTREIKRIEKNYQNWINNMPNRMKKFKPKYNSREEIDEAYLAGLLTNREYGRQKNLHRLVYSDRGSKRKLAWLYAERDQYQNQYDSLLEYIGELREKSTKRSQAKRNVANKKKRRELKKAEMKAREEACKYWKHIYDDVESEGEDK